MADWRAAAVEYRGAVDPSRRITVAVGLSMFPPMAPVAMMLRLAAPTGSVPIWQIVLSMGLLAGAGWLAIFVAGRIFRLGLLMHGKTPNLPEILRWVREA